MRRLTVPCALLACALCTMPLPAQGTADTLVVRDTVPSMPVDTLVLGPAARAIDFGLDRRPREGRLRFVIGSGKTYNRVEGLPVHIGPAYTDTSAGMRFRIEALGIIRSADTFRWTSENRGHLLRADVRPTATRGIGASLTAYDVVDAVEDWQMPRGEAGLATFLFHRDYRDHYGRHGAAGRATFFARPGTELSLEYARERWSSREVRQVFTILRNNHEWRGNPQMDEGRARLLTLRGRVDTRNEPRTPSSGWLTSAEYEFGDADIERHAPMSPVARVSTLPEIRYGRALFDVRRYNRITPASQLNLRMVAGGWLHGDELPLQRRFSVGGPATIPGYHFRDARHRTDALTCSDGNPPAGVPAQCERVLLFQAEYREELPWRPGTILGGTPLAIRSAALTLRPVFVAFADIGRGWLVPERHMGGATGGPDLLSPTDRLPPLRTFRTDIGVGVDFGLFGAYVAKSVSHWGESPNFFLRARSRF